MDWMNYFDRVAQIFHERGHLIGNIQLPFSVEKVITKFPLPFSYGTAMVYDDLNTSVDDLATANRNRTFTIVTSSTNLSEGDHNFVITRPLKIVIYGSLV